MDQSAKKTVLVVEDEESLLNPLSKKLEEENFNVLKARFGDEGLGLALESHPDLILLDIFMPHMDGMTVMHKIRQDSWGENALIIILTNVALNKDLLADVERDRPLDYIVKSDFGLDQIVGKIKEALNK